jgi:hypothetical protein
VQQIEKRPLLALIQNSSGHRFQDSREVVLLTRWLLAHKMDVHQPRIETSSRGMLSALVMAGTLREIRG